MVEGVDNKTRKCYLSYSPHEAVMVTALAYRRHRSQSARKSSRVGGERSENIAVMKKCRVQFIDIEEDSGPGRICKDRM